MPSFDARRADTGRVRTIVVVVVVTVAVGLVAGIGGVAVSLLLHAIQHVAYAYPTHAARFVEAAIATDPVRRFAALSAAGVVAGIGWWVLDRYGRKRVTIERAVAVDGPPMPVGTTIVHALLQIVTVALGSPLGREVAPREIGAATAGWLVQTARLPGSTARVLIACGAGAGLAAVYNVPWAGALFTMEVLLASFGWRAMVPALVTSLVATAVSRAVLGDVSQYTVPAFAVDASLVAWAAVCGPLFGLAGAAFRKAGAWARPTQPKHDVRTFGWSLAVFATIGALAWPFPELLGNGKGPAQFAFDGFVSVDRATALLVLKVFVVLAAIRAGAYGGLLTPAVACGALLAIVVGDGWSLWWPIVGIGACALVGATAFLAASMAMPLTATVLLFELTRMPLAFIVPVVVAVGGAVATSRAMSTFAARRRGRAQTIGDAAR